MKKLVAVLLVCCLLPIYVMADVISNANLIEEYKQLAIGEWEMLTDSAYPSGFKSSLTLTEENYEKDWLLFSSSSGVVYLYYLWYNSKQSTAMIAFNEDGNYMMCIPDDGYPFVYKKVEE